jgi:hypothetical protein
MVDIDSDVHGMPLIESFPFTQVEVPVVLEEGNVSDWLEEGEAGAVVAVGGALVAGAVVPVGVVPAGVVPVGVEGAVVSNPSLILLPIMNKKVRTRGITRITIIFLLNLLAKNPIKMNIAMAVLFPSII